MTTLELFKAIDKKASEIKLELTKSYFAGDKSYYNEIVSKFNKMPLSTNIYENINNISAKYAQSLNY